MARVLNVVPRERAFRPLMKAVRRVAAAHSFCPKCGSDDVRRSYRRTVPDILLACLFLAPFRCRKCRVRYYRFWRPALKQMAEPPRAPLLMMPRPMDIGPVEAVLVEPDSVETEIIQPERPLPRLVEVPATPPMRFIRSRSVLILESDLSIRKLLRRLLDRRGHFTHELLQPEDLAAELRERRVDLLIVDTLLFSANGPHAAFSLAHLHPHLKVLALSSDSFNGADLPDRCLALTKPFSLESFLDSVDKLLEPASAPDSE